MFAVFWRKVALIDQTFLLVADSGLWQGNCQNSLGKEIPLTKPNDPEREHVNANAKTIQLLRNSRAAHGMW